jgi:hypothetical protein
MLAITVNVSFDEFDNSITDGDISLRDAIDKAPIGETINFPSALNGQTITLLANLGEILIEKNLTIDASNLSLGLTINGNDPSTALGDGIRLFHITDPTFGDDPPLVTMKNLTLEEGDAGSENGGAIQSAGLLTLIDCTIQNNQATNGGGVHVFIPSGTVQRDGTSLGRDKFTTSTFQFLAPIIRTSTSVS